MNNIFKFRILGIAAFFAMIALFSVAAMLLWNALAPEIFGLPALSYWQATGLLILGRLIFGGGGGLGRLGMAGGLGGFHNRSNALRDRWMKMSKDEREQFLRYSHHHGFFGESPERWMSMSDEERRKFMRPIFGENENHGRQNTNEKEEGKK